MIRNNARRNKAAKHQVDALINGYGTMIAGRIEEGWQAYLLTMMFRQLGGRTPAVVEQMYAEAERLYRTFLPRVVRRPLSPRSLGMLPVLIAAPDVPVGKSNKPLAQVSINDGLHVHGVLVVPPVSRLRATVAEHFRTEPVVGAK